MRNLEFFKIKEVLVVGWIIAGSILLFILILLMSRATVIVDYDGDVFVKVKCFGITVYQKPGKKKSSEKSKKKSKKDEGDEKDEEGKKKKKKKPKKPKPTFDELMELLRMVLDSLGKPLKRILKRITFSHLSFDAVCGGDDAAKAAINYGAMNIALGSALNLIDQLFTLKTPDDLHIGVDFYQEKTVIKLYCEIRTTVGAALAFVFSLLGRAVKNYLSRKLARRAIKKLAAKPKEPEETKVSKDPGKAEREERKAG